MNKSIIEVPKILLPNTDLKKWSVVACDQFCASPTYWQQLENYIGDSPSALNIIFPEVYLSEDNSTRISKINATMEDYLKSGLFSEYEGFVLIERTFKTGTKRIGLVMAVDLDSYSWERVNVPIRATEDTIKDRLPVRVAIRANAPLELPHVMLLIDDTDKNIIESLYRDRNSLYKLYDFDLNMEGGHLTGYWVKDTDKTISKLYALMDKELQTAKYGEDKNVLFAVGDGNHSLATAKVHWDNLKSTLKEEEKLVHPARYALVEVVNVYGDGMDFEPIHRVLFGMDKDIILDMLKAEVSDTESEFVAAEDGIYTYKTDKSSGAAIKAIQDGIEAIIKKGVSVEYVHGDEHLRAAAKELDGIGIMMPKFLSSELFSYVLNIGNLPKKAFSIGAAEEKKYYVECRKIKENK